MRQPYKTILLILICVVFPLFTGCYQIYSGETEELRCGSQTGQAEVVPTESIVIFQSTDEHYQMVEPTGSIFISVENCVDNICDFRVDKMEINIPSPRIDGMTISNVMLTLETPGAQGSIDEKQGVNLVNTTFQALLSANVNGRDKVERLRSNDNIGGAFDVESGIIVLNGWLTHTRPDSMPPPVFPAGQIHFLFTANLNCND